MSNQKMPSAPQDVKFDADVSPEHPHNAQTAENLGLRYDARKQHYVDEDGCLARDKFGQPL